MDALFAEATASLRSDAWWRKRIATLSKGLGAELDDGLVVRARERALWPLAEYVVARAPATLRARAGRRAWPFERALDALGKRREQFARATLRAGFSRGHLLEIVVNLPGATGNEDDLGAAESLVWNVLGERLANDWVGAVKVAPAPRGGPLRVLATAKESGFALSELDAAVAAAIAGVYDGLPKEPHWARNDSDEWTLFELEAEPADDWADEDDLVMATTSVPELLKSRLTKQPFSSLRFSRAGELFLHLKYESDGEPEERLAQRQRLEDALDRSLIERKRGRVVGAGIGLRYSYVLLAVVDAERTATAIAELARPHVSSKRAWLIPLDTDLAHEWCGVWPDSPAPYGLVPEARNALE
ncbi:MAG TPA: hypothetical protein VFQ35_15935 [Polyangiaceae bacterium]|nr:hypothetical protein [Polyangiaceae bacterium]